MTTKTLSKRIRGFYRKNLKEYRILLIGNCLALATFIGAFISPFWIIDSSGQDKENYGSFWSLHTNKTTINVYQTRTDCSNGTIERLSLCKDQTGVFRILTTDDQKLFLTQLITLALQFAALVTDLFFFRESFYFTKNFSRLEKKSNKFIPFNIGLRRNGIPWASGKG